MYTQINNPGKGNCAFYAYAIGLIEIIQDQEREGHSPIFDYWAKVSPAIAGQKDAILRFNFIPESQNKRLLEKLQHALREMVYLYQCYQINNAVRKLPHHLSREEMIKFATTGRDALVNQWTYNEFANLVWCLYTKQPSAVYNELSRAPKVLDLANQLVARLHRLEQWIPEKALQNYIEQQIFHVFAKDLFGNDYFESHFMNNNPNSVILEGIAFVKKDHRQGTHCDLKRLSEIFNVNLRCLLNGKQQHFGRLLPDQPIITINNINDRHWTTVVKTDNVTDNKVYEAPLNRKEIHALFKSYATGYKAFFQTRHHLNMAKRIMRACDEKSKLEDITGFISSYLNNPDIHFNADSSFKKRAQLVLKMNNYFEIEDDRLDLDNKPLQFQN